MIVLIPSMHSCGRMIERHFVNAWMDARPSLICFNLEQKVMFLVDPDMSTFRGCYYKRSLLGVGPTLVKLI